MQKQFVQISALFCQTYIKLVGVAVKPEKLEKLEIIHREYTLDMTSVHHRASHNHTYRQFTVAKRSASVFLEGARGKKIENLEEHRQQKNIQRNYTN